MIFLHNISPDSLELLIILLFICLLICSYIIRTESAINKRHEDTINMLTMSPL